MQSEDSFFLFSDDEVLSDDEFLIDNEVLIDDELLIAINNLATTTVFM